MKAGRIVALVIGCIIALIGFLMFAGGLIATIAYGAGRDDDGYFRTDEVQLASPTAAITSENVDLDGAPSDAGWLSDRGDFATVSLEIAPTAPDREIFVGIGPTADVEAYLGSVATDRLVDFDESVDDITYERQEGSEDAAAPPAEQSFWVAQLATTQPAALDWDVESGEWTVVVMNADGSPGVDVGASVGIKFDWLLPVAIVLMVLGFLLLAGGIVIAVLATRGPRQSYAPARPGDPAWTGDPPPPATSDVPPPPATSDVPPPPATSDVPPPPPPTT